MQFPFSLDLGQFFADLRILDHIVVNAGIIRINRIAEHILLLPVLLKHPFSVVIGHVFWQTADLNSHFFEIIFA